MLSKLCAIEKDFPGADFYFVSSGDSSESCKPTLEYNADHIGVKFRDSKKFNGKMMFYIFFNSWEKGRFESLIKTYSDSGIKYVTVEDIKKFEINIF